MKMGKPYPQELKESLVEKMVAPQFTSVKKLARETGISDVTLYAWRNKYLQKGVSMPVNKSKKSRWTAEEKLAVVIETAAMNEAEISEFCRSNGLYLEDIKGWKDAALSGYSLQETNQKKIKEKQQTDTKKIKTLERELRRKEKALAETAALLVLSKKLTAIWGEEEDN